MWTAVLVASSLCLLPLAAAQSRVISSFDTKWRFLKGGAGGFLPSGVGWYRKEFARSGAENQRVFIQFDGVMANSEAWINGVRLGKRPYGYVSFQYELTPHLRTGKNVLAVRVAARLPLVYRRRHLQACASAHHGSGAPCAMEHRGDDAAHSVSVQFSLAGPDGKTVQTLEAPAQTITPGASATFQAGLNAQKPQLWDIGRPALYQATLQVRDKGTIADEETTPLGIREFHFDPATGFWLNGKNFKLKGVALHHDGGAVGAAVPLGVRERRLTEFKEFGVNAVRTAHNPAAPEFLDLCDPMGVLVMEEMFDTWKHAKNPYDYRLYFDEWSKIDTGDTVRRDRNHPSIILYSAGNEIRDTPKADLAKNILRPLVDVIGQNYRENENGHDLKVWQALRDHPAYSGQFLWTGFDYLGESRAWPRVGAGSGLIDRTGRPRSLTFRWFTLRGWFGRVARHPPIRGSSLCSGGRRSFRTGHRPTRLLSRRMSRSTVTAKRWSCC